VEYPFKNENINSFYFQKLTVLVPRRESLNDFDFKKVNSDRFSFFSQPWSATPGTLHHSSTISSSIHQPVHPSIEYSISEMGFSS